MTALLSQAIVPPLLLTKDTPLKSALELTSTSKAGPLFCATVPPRRKASEFLIDPDGGTGRVGATAVVLNLICAEEPGLAVGVQVDSDAGVTGNLNVGQGHLAPEADGDSNRPISTDGGLRDENGNPGTLAHGNSPGFIALDEVWTIVGGELHLRSTHEINTRYAVVCGCGVA